MGRSHRASVIPSKILNKSNNILDCYNHHQYLSPDEVIRAKLNSYHRGNHHYQPKRDNLDYKKSSE